VWKVRPRKVDARTTAQSSTTARLLSELRARRRDAALTQAEVGVKAGITGKYVSELERGTRDLPFSTLHALVERGLGLSLEVRATDGGRRTVVELPPKIAELARAVAELGDEQRASVLAILREALRLIDR